MSLMDGIGNPFQKAALAAFEPELPEDQRRGVAWANVQKIAGYPLWALDQDGRMIHWDAYGQTTDHGWHIHHRLDQALGGRHTASNLVARHWLGNTQAGGVLGALLRG